MTTIIPTRDLKNPADVSRLVHELDEPVHVSKNGKSDMVIMSAEYYQREFFNKWLYDMVKEGERDIMMGHTRDAFEALDELKEKYDLHD